MFWALILKTKPLQENQKRPSTIEKMSLPAKVCQHWLKQDYTIFSSRSRTDEAFNKSSKSLYCSCHNTKKIEQRIEVNI